jgi:UDP-N-acetylmuramoyl-tripeptide--D-alanyl-D-alanine ligase
MIAHVVRDRDDVLVSERNFNNLVGVPLHLLRLKKDHRLAVLEIGMNERGELKRLTRMTRPTLAAFTNMGTAHVGQFGSLEGLLKAKGEFLQELDRGTPLIFNADCSLTKELFSRFSVPDETRTFGIENTATWRARDIRPLAPYGYRFNIETYDESFEIELNVFGRHNIYNALCATAILQGLGLPLGEVAERLRDFKAYSMRSEVEEFQGIYLIKDCYNSSFEAATGAVRELPGFAGGTGRAIAVLGQMRELGEMETELHKKLGDECAEAGIDVVIGLGDMGSVIVEQVTQQDTKGYHFNTQEECAGFLSEFVKPGDTVLFKASRLLCF